MWPFSNISLEAATKLGDLANAALLVSLAAGAVSTFLVVQAANVKEEFWERERLAARQEAARLSAQARDSEARISEAKATLERERRLRAEFEAKFSWRTIPDPLATTLIAILRTNVGSVRVRYAVGDMESAYYMIQITAILQRANWSVSVESATYTNTVFFGLFISEQSSSKAKFLRNALLICGFQVADQEPMPSMVVANGRTVSEPEATITVGPRPLPGTPAQLP